RPLGRPASRRSRTTASVRGRFAATGPRVVAKAAWCAGEQVPRVGFIVTKTKTLRVGDELRLAGVALTLPAGKALVLGRIYSYDLTLQIPSTTHTLKSLGLLRHDPFSDSFAIG